MLSDQLLLIFLIHINAALHSDLLGKGNLLKCKNVCLEYRLKSQFTPITKELTRLVDAGRIARRKMIWAGINGQRSLKSSNLKPQ